MDYRTLFKDQLDRSKATCSIKMDRALVAFVYFFTIKRGYLLIDHLHMACIHVLSGHEHVKSILENNNDV